MGFLWVNQCGQHKYDIHLCVLKTVFNTVFNTEMGIVVIRNNMFWKHKFCTFCTDLVADGFKATPYLDIQAWGEILSTVKEIQWNKFK